MAKDAARQRLKRALDLVDLSEKKREMTWCIRAESRTGIEAALALARSTPPIADSGAGWDADHWILGTRTKVAELKTGALRDGTREDRLTLSTGVDPDPNIDCPRFKQFLLEILGEDQESIDFLQRLVGYSLTGLTSEQIFVMLHGRGANGKSVLLAILRQLLGEYAHNAPFSTFETASRPSIPNDLAALADKRLVTASETTEGARLNESRLKALTGGDPITARFLNREWFTFEPVCTIWLAVNHKPRVNDDSYGFWRRVVLIALERQFREDADPHLLEKLSAELPGILAWAIQGCLAWQHDGLQIPKAVKALTEDYRIDADPIGGFLAEVCITGSSYAVGATALYGAYLHWAGDQGLREKELIS
jgi:putative DNA primase/helicase